MLGLEKERDIMCFSSHVSFGAAAVLAIIGLLSLKKAKTRNETLLATTPLFFAAQQAFEGVLWVGYHRDIPPIIITLAKYGFLFFAMLFWPIWIPLVMYKLEKQELRKSILGTFLMGGILLACYFVWQMGCAGGHAWIEKHHVTYDIGLTEWQYFISGIIYAIITIGSFFVSSVPYMWTLGLTLAIALLIAYIFYTFWLVSVWCFFSAFISILIYAIICSKNRK